jgi:putative drug exporter of the RND superfamily
VRESQHTKTGAADGLTAAGSRDTPSDRCRQWTPDNRLATLLRRLRWPAVIAWLLAIVALNGLSGSLSKATNDTASAYLPAAAASTKVALLQQAHLDGQSQTDTAIVVAARDSGLTPADQAALAAARTAVAGFAGLIPGMAAPGPLLSSPDGKAAVFSVSITGPSSGENIDDAVQAVRAAIAGPLGKAGTGLAFAVTGSAAIYADGNAGNQRTLLLLTALIIVAVILLLVYRSPVLWLLPLSGAIGAIIVAQASVHGLANAGLTVSTLSADILVVLVFGAASDYALLLVHRYREEFRQHTTAEEAMATALRRTLPTLIASAGTVTCALICLLAANSTALRGLGPVGAAGIVAALLAQTTFLPALLLVLGRAAFWPRTPEHGAGRAESWVWAGIAARVARYPLRTVIVVVVLLGVACAGFASLRTDDSLLDNMKSGTDSATGQKLIDAHFPADISYPLVLFVPPGQAGAAAAAAGSAWGVRGVVPDTPVDGYDNYWVILSVPPFGAEGSAAISGLRQRLTHDAPDALVGGIPAIQYDVAQAADRDNLVIIPLVLVVILIVISLLLRAIVAPVVLVVTTGMSFAASLALSSLIWRFGFGYGGVQSVIPIYIFIFLVTLGVDYNVFLVARIREESAQLGLRHGTLRGVGVTGGVITAAGIVLAGTFAALTQNPAVNISEVGVAVALGVLLDALVIRTVLVPASLLTIGERAWWPSRSRPILREPSSDEALTWTE